MFRWEATTLDCFRPKGDGGLCVRVWFTMCGLHIHWPESPDSCIAVCWGGRLSLLQYSRHSRSTQHLHSSRCKHRLVHLSSSNYPTLKALENEEWMCMHYGWEPPSSHRRILNQWFPSMNGFILTHCSALMSQGHCPTTSWSITSLVQLPQHWN